MLFTPKWSFFRHYDREVAGVFPILFDEATTRTGMRSRAIKSESNIYRWTELLD